jgi:hypothetical protein
MSPSRGPWHRARDVIDTLAVVVAVLTASGRIAQLVEQLTLNQRVQGSSPCAPTIISLIILTFFAGAVARDGKV